MRFSLFICLIAAPCYAQAQTDDAPHPVTQISIDAGFSGLMASAELPTGASSTVQFRGGIMPLAYTEEQNYSNQAMRLFFSPAVSASYRQYYNFQKRVDRGEGY